VESDDLAGKGGGSAASSGGGSEGGDGLLTAKGGGSGLGMNDNMRLSGGSGNQAQHRGCGSHRVRTPCRQRRPGCVAACGCVGGRRVCVANAQNGRTQCTCGQHDSAPHHPNARQFVHHVRWILQDQPRDNRQVQAEDRINFVRVRQVHGLVHAGLPPAPTLLLVDDDDSRTDHFDSPG
jgi:hypothetical protein